jgi:hypothetical protein
MALLVDTTTLAVEAAIAVEHRRAHWVWRSASRDTVCGRDVFGKYLARTTAMVTCPSCVQVIGIATMAADRPFMR